MKLNNLIKKYYLPRALIIGGGKGKEISELLKMGYEVHSVDPSYRKNIHRGKLFLHKEIIQNFKFEKYSIVIAFNSLQFLGKDAEEIIKKVFNSCEIFIGSIPIKFRSKDINKDCSIDFKSIIKPLKPIYIKEYWINDKPHQGVNFKHKHYMLDFIVKK